MERRIVPVFNGFTSDDIDFINLLNQAWLLDFNSDVEISREDFLESFLLHTKRTALSLEAYLDNGCSFELSNDFFD